VWPGPTTQAGAFQFTATGWGPTSGPVELTLSGPAFPNAAHQATASLTMVPSPSAAQSGAKGFPTAFPATLQGTAASFPDLAKLAPGRYRFRAQFRGAGEVVGTPAPTTVEVDVAKPPKEKGATITSITSVAPGFFTGDPQQLAVGGTPGNLGMCDAYKLQLTAITGGTNQALTFANKTFPETLSGGSDFGTLATGVWDAAATASGSLCAGSADTLVEVDSPPGPFTDRPMLAVVASPGSQTIVNVTLPASYANLPTAANVACCATDLYVQSAAGTWTSAGGVVSQNYGDPTDQNDGTELYQAAIPLSTFQQTTASAAQWALRVRATAPGQSFAWSNFAVFNVSP
jgi:hypothetical protein